MDIGAWYATVHGVTKSQTWPSGYAEQVERGKKKKNYFLTFFIYPVSGKLFIMCATNNKKKKWANSKHFQKVSPSLQIWLNLICFSLAAHQSRERQGKEDFPEPE